MVCPRCIETVKEIFKLNIKTSYIQLGEVSISENINDSLRKLL
jgi:hypothetical protein